MARNLNKEQRAYLITKAFEVLEEKLTPIRKKEMDENNKITLTLFERAFQRLSKQPDPLEHAHRSGKTFTFTVAMDDKDIKGQDGSGNVMTNIQQSTWHRHSIGYMGATSKRIAEKGAKILEDFHGQLIMQNVEGSAQLLEYLVVAIKALK